MRRHWHQHRLNKSNSHYEAGSPPDDRMKHSDKKQAYRALRELSHVLPHISREALPYVARGVGNTLGIPRKAMLVVMARYVRLYRAVK